MLGYSYWQYLKEGLPAGEALRRAKVDMARQMHQSQGFLDGEDQKTLIQFVLYGDPLATLKLEQSKRRSPSADVNRSLEQTYIKTVQEQNEASTSSLSPETVETVKEAVAKYLPGLADASMSSSRLFPELNGQSPRRAGNKPTPKSYSAERLPRQVVTLRKEVQSKSITHQIYARLTLDEEGDVVKMTVSR